MYPEIEKLKEILLKEHYITVDNSQDAEENSHDVAEYVDYLIREELLTKNLLGQAIAEYYDLPYADLERVPATKESVAFVPEEVARTQHVVFIKGNEKAVALATDMPDKVDLKVLSPYFKGKKIHLAYALPEYMTLSFSLYSKPLDTRFSQIVSKGQRVAPEIVEEIVRDALSFRASDIHMEPHEDGIMVRFRIDGTLRDAGKIPREYFPTILNRIKVASGMRIDEHFIAQDGSLQIKEGAISADMRVSLAPTVEGEKIVLRLLSSYVQNFTLSDLGLSEQQRDAFETAARKPFGMLLTTGPTGSGKTTTMYALLKLMNHPDVNITTIEDPVEYKIKGVNQIQVRSGTGITFSNGLRSIVRQDPDIILVGEIRDRSTAEISVNAALTGHLLLSTFHANDAATAIPRLLEMGVEPFLLASTLEAVMAQRLVRKICPHCRVSVPLEETLMNLRGSQEVVREYIAAGDTVYVGKGCEVCNGSGYKGRTALFEIITSTPELQDIIMTRPSGQEIAKLASRQGFRNMFQDGMDKVKHGITTISEVLRVAEPGPEEPKHV